MNSAFPRHGGNLREEAQKLGIKENDLLDASASLVPFTPPKALQECLQEAVLNHSLKSYPDTKYLNLREAIGSLHGVDSEMVLPGNGVAELLTWCARDAADNGISTLPTPGFSDYERALKCWNAPYLHQKLPLKWDQNKSYIFPFFPKTNVIWITNPHNPTGQLWCRESLEQLLKKYQLIICDEAFLSLVPDGEKQSLIPLVNSNPNLIVLRSLTKLFSIAGLRLGYAIGNANRLERWREWRDPWPVNGFAVAAGEMIMGDPSGLREWTDQIHNWILQENPWLQSEFAKFPTINSHPSSTNFQLIQSKTSLISLRENLAKNKILVRDCRSFKGLGENWLRVSLQTREKNIKIIDAVKKIIL